MSRALLLAPALLCALAATVPARQTPAPSPTPRGLFERAAQVPEPSAENNAEPEAFEFERSGHRYRVTANGAGRRAKIGQENRAARPRLFNLWLEGADRITRLYFAEYEGNLLLACEVSDGQSGGGFVARLEQPSMRTLWRAQLPAAGLGPPLRDGGDLYLTGGGFAAKLALKTGLFVWEHPRLPARAGEGTFASLSPPELSGDAAVFREAGVSGRPPKTLRVHRKTGKILGIE